ncbi:MAG: hypothetical protein ACRD1R_18895, partial [Acidobacteriota bacterium]
NDNGHRMIFPSLFKLIELKLFGGYQVLQLASGALFAFAAWVVIVVTVLRDPTVRENNRWSIFDVCPPEWWNFGVNGLADSIVEGSDTQASAGHLKGA